MPGRKEITLIAISLLFAAVVAEIGLRIAGIAFPIFHQMEPLRGWAPLPGVSGMWRTEGEAHVSINREGFRDRDHEIVKPQGTFRIAILGDSMTEGLAVPVSTTFWSVLEKDLETCEALNGRKVEVLNYGVSGYGPAQERLTLRNNALKYKPDLVLLALFTGNDILNSERALDGHKDRVYYTLDQGVLTLDDSNTQAFRFKWKRFWRTLRNAIINTSNLFQVIREGTTRLRNLMRANDSGDSKAVFAPTGREYEVFRAPKTPEWQKGWATTEALVTAIHKDSVSSGAEFLLAILPGPVQVYPDAALRQNFAMSLNVNDLDYADRRLTAFAASAEIPALALKEPLRHFADETGTFLHGFPNSVLGIGHWNVEGHRVAGETLARKICGNSP